jgi:hypothetical protein
MKTKIFKLIFLVIVVSFTSWLMAKGMEQNEFPSVKASIHAPLNQSNLSARLVGKAG